MGHTLLAQRPGLDAVHRRPRCRGGGSGGEPFSAVLSRATEAIRCLGWLAPTAAPRSLQRIERQPAFRDRSGRPGGRIVALDPQPVKAQDELARLEAGSLGTPMIGHARKRQVDALIHQARGETESFADEQRRAEAGRRAAEAERPVRAAVHRAP